jgi:acyl-CoA thioester hydrolase
METSKVHHAHLRVEFEDCDAMGVVYHPNYLRFIERSRVSFLKEHGLPFASMLNIGFGMVIGEIHSFYWRPARFEDELHVYTRQVTFGEKKLTVEQIIVQEKLSIQEQSMPMNRMPGRVFGAKVHLTCIELASMRSAAFPEEIAKILSRLTIALNSD